MASVLAHMAFWDQRSALLLERWQRDGVTPPPDDEANIDWINYATRPLFLEVVPAPRHRIAAALCQRQDRTRPTRGPACQREARSRMFRTQ